MIEITLMTNKSEKNKIDKDLDTIKTISGTLKESTTIGNPTISVKGFSDFATCNYIYIPSFNRYYFVTNINIVNSNVYEIECKCDVLESFKSHILNNIAVISKNESRFKLYLPNEDIKVSSRPKNAIINFDYSFDDSQVVLLMAGSSYQTFQG